MYDETNVVAGFTGRSFYFKNGEGEEWVPPHPTMKTISNILTNLTSEPEFEKISTFSPKNFEFGEKV